MTIRKLLTLTVCTALLGCSDDPEQTQQVPPTTGFGNRLSGLTAIIPEAGVTDKSSTTRTGAAETGATVWLVDDAITVTDGLHAGTFDVATGIGTATGKFNGSLDFEQTPLYAVYPAVSAMNGFTAPVVIGTMQNARTAGANNIMTARCEEVKAASESQFVFRKKAATAQLSFDFTSEGKYASEKGQFHQDYGRRRKFRGCMRLRPDRSRRSAPGIVQQHHLHVQRSPVAGR